MTPELQRLLEQWNKLSFSDRYQVMKLLSIGDGFNIQLGGTTGTKIGTATTQKLAFFGASPVIQQTKATAPSGGGGADNDAIDITGRTAINSIIATLTALGLTN